MNIDSLSKHYREQATQRIDNVLKDLDRREPDGTDTIQDPGSQGRAIAREKLSDIKSDIDAGGFNGFKSAFKVSALGEYESADISKQEKMLSKITGHEIFLPHLQR